VANGADAVANGADAVANGADAVANGADAVANGADAVANVADAVANVAGAVANVAGAVANGADGGVPVTASQRDASCQPGVKLRGPDSPGTRRVLQGRLMQGGVEGDHAGRSPHEASRWDAVSPTIRSQGFHPWLELSLWDEDPQSGRPTMPPSKVAG